MLKDFFNHIRLVDKADERISPYNELAKERVKPSYRVGIETPCEKRAPALCGGSFSSCRYRYDLFLANVGLRRSADDGTFLLFGDETIIHLPVRFVGNATHILAMVAIVALARTLLF